MALAQFRFRQGTTAQWAESSAILALGEPGIDTDLKRMKIGDGQNQWALLKWQDVDPVTLARIETVAEAVQDATGANDAVMTMVAADPTSAFAKAVSLTVAGSTESVVAPIRVSVEKRAQTIAVPGIASGDSLFRKAVVGWDGGWLGLGARVAARAATLTASADAVAGEHVSVHPAYSQLLRNSAFAGGTPGTILSGGGSTAVLPTGWSTYATSLNKELLASGNGAIRWKGLAWTNYATGGRTAGGWRSPDYFTPTGDVTVTFTGSITNVPDSLDVRLVWAWHNQTTGLLENAVGLSGNESLSSLGAQGRRTTVTLANPGGPRALVWMLWTPSSSTAGVEPINAMGDVTVSYRDEAGDRPKNQVPTAISSGAPFPVPARDVTLAAPDGNYFAILQNDAGRWFGRAVTVSGGSFSLLAACGGPNRIRRFALVPASSYQPAETEGLIRPTFRSALTTPPGATAATADTEAVSWLVQRPGTVSGRGANGGSPLRSVLVSENVQSYGRFTAEPGVVDPDDKVSQERAEAAYYQSFDYGVPFGFAGWFTCDQMIYEGPKPIVVRQLRYVKSPDPNANPEVTMNMYPRAAPGKWGLQFRGVVDAIPVVGAPENALKVVKFTDGADIMDFDFGQWVYIAMLAKPATDGTGLLRVWINETGKPGEGRQVVNANNINLGYSDVTQFRVRFGNYANAWATTRINRHHQVEFYPNMDAASMADFPPPRLIT